MLTSVTSLKWECLTSRRERTCGRQQRSLALQPVANRRPGRSEAVAEVVVVLWVLWTVTLPTEDCQEVLTASMHVYGYVVNCVLCIRRCETNEIQSATVVNHFLARGPNRETNNACGPNCL